MKGVAILALDQGTTSSRALVINGEGRVLASAQEEFRQIYPRPGWVEHDPMDIWSSQSATMAGALSKANLAGDEIAALGLTNQRETTVVWERSSGKPIYNAIVWQDRRTASVCEQLKADGVEDWVMQKTGLRLDPYFSATKIGWILDHVEGARKRAERGELCFGTVDSWLLWRLTGGAKHRTDVTNASRTLLMNIETESWDDSLLELFGIPRAMLPEIGDSAGEHGEVDLRVFPARVPICGIAGDQHAALFGQACFEPGMAKNTYGTGCFLLMNTGERIVRSENNLLTTVAWRIGGRTEYALEGSVFIGGAVVQWLRDELMLVRSAQEVDAVAATVEDSGGAFLVPAFAGLGAPHWDPFARGTLIGISRGTNRAHLCRAALESIAFQTADLIDCMEKDAGIGLKELRVDGGASRSSVILAFQADLLGKDVVRPVNTETTALGAAFFAGLASGFWKDRESLRRCWKEDRAFRPSRPISETATLRRNWNRAVERSRSWEDAVG